MNKFQLRTVCLKISKETGLSFNTIQTQFFLESILEKIANSDENENFIFKGGFLLTSVIGIRQRSTVDLDFLIRRFSLTAQNIEERFARILQGGQSNDITYDIKNIEEIRKENEYGGFRVKILCRLENIKQVIPLDIATGDPITPSDISYEYKSLFSDKSFTICAYNIETMIAEKLQTIFQRGVFNSRSKDYYDIYILYRLKKNEINLENLKKACQQTFLYRNMPFTTDSIIDVLMILKNEKGLEKQWKNYQKRFSYADGLKFNDVIDTIIELVEIMI